MPLNIETFSNVVGGNAFYKAITHPLAAASANAFASEMRACGPVGVYDPHNLMSAFDALYPLEGLEIAGYFVQNVEDVGRIFRGAEAQSLVGLENCECDTIIIAEFDATATEERIRRLYGPDASFLSFDRLRIPEEFLSNKQHYLSNLNFATNFAFFREADGHHTRLVTANYWGGYGSPEVSIWFMLFAEDGGELATWRQALPRAGAAVVVDSEEVRRRFSLPEFTGQLLLHVVGAAGHDVVKYALDTYGDMPGALSCTHDANSWPANRYAGLPAPDENEEVVLWVQNSHPFAIASGEIGLNVMGDERLAFLQRSVAPFATYRLSVSDLLPEAHWPQQVEIHAGKHMVRPRYEVIRGDGHRNIAHPNVEREDLKLDEMLPKLNAVLGKGFILPAPILPPERYSSFALPTPMSTVQNRLPVKLLLYDAQGSKVAEHSFGNLARKDSVVLNLNDALGNQALEGGYGHMELVYDFDAGTEVDGWMHALFRYVDLKSSHRAETSFGAHIFNILTTYKNEPQSYKGPPPGLSTRLFLRVGPEPYETQCHLIYAASRRWHETSDTHLILMSGDGEEVVRRTVQIPCGGSLLWRVGEMFEVAERKEAGDGCYVVIRDSSCRLFGYHGLVNNMDEFSLDHMFGF